jgi:SAM-dependent methyltransferase
MKKWYEIENEKFIGWDFTEINRFTNHDPVPWDYKKIVEHFIEPNHKLLDMGTGGGEFLLTLQLPDVTCATEQYEPNYMYAKEKLSQKGIDLSLVKSDCELPYPDEYFDIIINRHESFDLREVTRILKSDGVFITQQVGSYNTYEFSKWLLGDVREDKESFTLKTVLAELKGQPLKLLQSNEAILDYEFLQVEAFIRFARIIEWEFPGFSVEKCYDKLLQLDKLIREKGSFYMKEHRFYVVVNKD